ncbi:hypothetical protein [Acidovorax sp. A1169]|uniref:hypothetical protein n=1 Tax=Acidovorax sp. A1169 TaxID=3059524 RepID=UPI0027378F92|nr:hypothetical protein [Acidovorax sp. A1169]MDP4077889.1 hypothetical protein [Acidovorax sp. A1169]
MEAKAPPAPVAKPVAQELPPDPTGKYARCAGSTEPLKCRAMVDSMASETPETKAARIAKLDNERKAAAAQVGSQPVMQQSAQQSVVPTLSVGMRADDVLNSDWGSPQHVNKTTTQYGTREQWVYRNGNYLYFENGRLSGIQTRE